VLYKGGGSVVARKKELMRFNQSILALTGQKLK
jgi:hypothetical protein